MVNPNHDVARQVFHIVRNAQEAASAELGAAFDAEEERTAEDLAAGMRMLEQDYPACSACRDGSRLCPTPEACRLAERPQRNAGRTALILGLVLSTLGTAALLLGMKGLMR